MVRQISDKELATAHAAAAAMARCWQRSRSGIDRILAEQLGTEVAQLESARLDAANKAGRP
jgi:hypothetical protein